MNWGHAYQGRSHSSDSNRRENPELLSEVALLSEGKYDVILSAPNREVEARNLRLLRAELPPVWSDISNAMRGFKDHSLQMLVLGEVLGLERC